MHRVPELCAEYKQTSRKVDEVTNTIRGAISNDPINAVYRQKLDENIQQLVTNSFNQNDFKAIAKHLFELGLQQFKSYLTNVSIQTFCLPAAYLAASQLMMQLVNKNRLSTYGKVTWRTMNVSSTEEIGKNDKQAPGS